MKLEIAGPSQSASLVEFYKGFSTQGLVQMKIDRGQNFFKPYDLQSDRHITYIMQDEESGKVEGSASFVINNVLLEGQVMSVAFG